MAGARCGRSREANLTIVAKGSGGRNIRPPRAYTGGMNYLLPTLLIVSAAAVAAQEQERKVPNDSQRITVPGCANGRTFIVAAREGHEPTSGELAPGRRFRLSGN